VTVYVALLRGINVGGVKLPMADLRHLAESAGLTDPRTYIQSGNLVFSSRRRGIDKIAAELRAAIKDELSLDIPVIVRTATELAAVIDNNPFIAAGLDGQQQSVAFFAARVAANVFRDVDLAKYAPEAAAVHGREIYFNLPVGTGHSPMLKDIGRRPAIKIGTVRNWRTVTTLLGLATEGR
jgi:uncharacterized protein (DUF1697 family)